MNNDFRHIREFLEKISLLIKEKEDFSVQASSVISDKIKFKIEPQNLKIKNGFIFIKTAPIIKNEIFLKKNLILEELNKNPSIKIFDIK